MSRNLYLLAGTLAFLAFASFLAGLLSAPTVALGWTWRALAMLMLLGALIAALLATLTALFEQVDRRHQARRASKRRL